MANTPRLAVPYIAQGDSSKEQYHNEALNVYDLLVQCTVIDRDLSTPPGSPTEGDAYIVGSGGTGVWATHDDDLAIYISAQWVFRTPAEGWLAYVQDENAFLYWDGSTWALLSGGAGGAPIGAQYVTLATHASLTNERVLTAGTNISLPDTGAGGTVTVHALTENISFPADISPAQLTADTDDYAPTGLATASTLRLSADASRNITGLTGGADGRIILAHNVGSFSLTLMDESAASTASNRFAMAGNITLAPDDSCILRYDATSSRWRLLASSVAPPAGYTDEQAQDAVGAMVDSTLTYTDAIPLLSRAALTGDVTASTGSNATTIANDAVTYAKMQNISAASRLLGRGSAAGSGDPQEISLGSGLSLSGTTLSVSAGAGGTPNRDWFVYAAAKLEPEALETPKTGTFSYAVSGGPKMVISAWQCSLGASSRIDVRNTLAPLFLNDMTLTGTGTHSSAIVIDPSLPTYADAEAIYYERLTTLALSPQKILTITGLSTSSTTSFMFLPGPYGNIITHVTQFDFVWVAFANHGGPDKAWPVWDEIGDTGSSDYIRLGIQLSYPVSKVTTNRLVCGQEKSTGIGKGAILHAILPATWSAVVDSNSYDFRDDFLGTSLDTGTDWTRTQSTAGNVEIDTAWAWMQVKGNDTWGANGCFSQTGVTRANGKVFLCDVYLNSTGGFLHNLVVGWHDGSGHDYTDFSHGIDFTVSGGSPTIQIFENGTSRGAVGSGYTERNIYRVRITLGASNNATYEIQGGPEYQGIGSGSWSNITPGTSSSSTTPVYAGVTRQTNDAYDYVGDVRIY